MNEREKLAMLEDMMELDEGTLASDMLLNEIEEYDSMAKLSLIVLMEDDFGVKLTGEIIRNFKTVGDILELMKKA